MLRGSFSIVKAVELLERAYVRDTITAKEYGRSALLSRCFPSHIFYLRDVCVMFRYTPACTKLLAQFKTALTLLPGLDIKQFLRDYKLECPAAENRLLHIGVPATVEFANPESVPKGTRSSALVFSPFRLHVHMRVYMCIGAGVVVEATQHFITAMDSIKLKMVAADQLQPLLKDLLESLNKMPSLSADWDGKVKLRSWCAPFSTCSHITVFRRWRGERCVCAAAGLFC
jgi:hypothetical protein